MMKKELLFLLNPGLFLTQKNEHIYFKLSIPNKKEESIIYLDSLYFVKTGGNEHYHTYDLVLKFPITLPDPLSMRHHIYLTGYYFTLLEGARIEIVTFSQHIECNTRIIDLCSLRGNSYIRVGAMKYELKYSHGELFLQKVKIQVGYQGSI